MKPEKAPNSIFNNLKSIGVTLYSYNTCYFLIILHRGKLYSKGDAISLFNYTLSFVARSKPTISGASGLPLSSYGVNSTVNCVKEITICSTGF